MAKSVLAGDVGGTKTLVARYEVRDADAGGKDLVQMHERTFLSRDHPSLEQVITEFLQEDPGPVCACVFGVAGPVLEGRVVATNLPWDTIRVQGLAQVLGLAPGQARLLNDLEAMAYGALYLDDSDLHTLNAGVKRRGNIAVIAAGTGLGQAFLFWDGQRHRPSATEGGNTSFAPRSDREMELLRFLQQRHGCVAHENVVSGPGLGNLFDFLVTVEKRVVSEELQERMKREDPAAVIGEAGVAGDCSTCREVVDWFVEIYGAQAGNQALTVMALGGVFIGGGIVTKILPRMAEGAFLEAFWNKGPNEKLLREVPVKIILNPGTSLLGAARTARDLIQRDRRRKNP